MSTKTKYIKNKKRIKEKKNIKQDPDFLEAISSLNYITIDGQFLSNSRSVHQSPTIDTLRFVVGLHLLQTASSTSYPYWAMAAFITFHS
jgi:hypothetical protein